MKYQAKPKEDKDEAIVEEGEDPAVNQDQKAVDYYDEEEEGENKENPNEEENEYIRKQSEDDYTEFLA